MTEKPGVSLGQQNCIRGYHGYCDINFPFVPGTTYYFTFVKASQSTNGIREHYQHRRWEL